MTAVDATEPRGDTPSEATRHVVFTDLDGTLLGHYDYGFEEALPLLKRLQRLGIPVVPASSKTFAELVGLRRTLRSEDPFLVENGAAIVVPEARCEELSVRLHVSIDEDPARSTCRAAHADGEAFTVLELAPPHERWMELLAECSAKWPGAFETFSGLSTAEVADRTGLDEASARLARQRWYSEPVHWLGDDETLAAFTEHLIAAGAGITRGGRFLSIGAPATSKADAIAHLMRHYRAAWTDSTVLSVAVGDAPNDVTMLQEADRAAIVQSPAHEPPRVPGRPDLFVSPSPAPRGWVEAIEHILDL